MHLSRSPFIYRSLFALSALICICGTASAQWVDFRDETSSRISLTTVGLFDNQEKDMFTDDFDRDGDPDVAVCRKLPFSNPGAEENVLLMNENGVLVDRTMLYAPSFLTADDNA